MKNFTVLVVTLSGDTTAAGAWVFEPVEVEVLGASGSAMQPTDLEDMRRRLQRWWHGANSLKVGRVNLRIR